MSKSTGKGIRAVVAGVLFIILVTTVVDVALHFAKIYPTDKLTDALALLASSYRLIIGVAGAYLTAKLAPANPLKHALIIGYVGIGLGLVGVAATWNLDLGPRWYAISLPLLAVPQCWFGGWLFTRRLSAGPA